MKYEKIKLEELKYLNNANLKNSSNIFDHVQLLIVNVDYSTESRQKYSLLNKLKITANKTSSNSYNLSTTCEKANLYLHVDFIKQFLHSKSFNTFANEFSRNNVTNSSNNVFSTLTNQSKVLIINLKILNSYIHFIDVPQSSTNISKLTFLAS